MTLDVFELSLAKRLSFAEIARFLADRLPLVYENIVGHDAYWDLPAQAQATGVCLDMVEADPPFLTLASGVCALPLYGERLGELARQAAEYFDTRVVIGDYRAEVATQQDRLLCFWPDGRVFVAIDLSKDDRNDIDVVRALSPDETRNLYPGG